MTDVELLQEKINKSGLKRTYIAEQLGITYQGFLNKVSGKNEFKVNEVSKLCDLLSIMTLSEKERIFFANKVD